MPPNLNNGIIESKKKKRKRKKNNKKKSGELKFFYKLKILYFSSFRFISRPILSMEENFRESNTMALQSSSSLLERSCRKIPTTKPETFAKVTELRRVQ